jgi:hypothetical protein
MVFLIRITETEIIYLLKALTDIGYLVRINPAHDWSEGARLLVCLSPASQSQPLSPPSSLSLHPQWSQQVVVSF